MGFQLCRGGSWQSQSPEGEEEDGVLTRPTSTSLVIITMLEQCSCHTMRQKSYTISCLGPAGRRKGCRGRTGSAPMPPRLPSSAAFTAPQHFKHPVPPGTCGAVGQQEGWELLHITTTPSGPELAPSLPFLPTQG